MGALMTLVCSCGMGQIGTPPILSPVLSPGGCGRVSLYLHSRTLARILLLLHPHPHPPSHTAPRPPIQPARRHRTPARPHPPTMRREPWQHAIGRTPSSAICRPVCATAVAGQTRRRCCRVVTSGPLPAVDCICMYKYVCMYVRRDASTHPSLVLWPWICALAPPSTTTVRRRLLSPCVHALHSQGTQGVELPHVLFHIASVLRCAALLYAAW